ncbi:hypothetical protein CROQUDRAFT_86334 [Cronartium quercuum f. sp. fusiforme G11]|uniref:Uncharacterized protein n=1 Tax=Cronartium quercuum f. sp. fusiforme G11 TaxID=708437 RepID=A0A9P6NWK1_9BASI|nr:hypothetical protein CROQUDRAFT_86334 [Cronartium quercuum f. sp. fusiforme G11]
MLMIKKIYVFTRLLPLLYILIHQTFTLPFIRLASVIGIHPEVSTVKRPVVTELFERIQELPGMRNEGIEQAIKAHELKYPTLDPVTYMEKSKNSFSDTVGGFSPEIDYGILTSA